MPIHIGIYNINKHSINIIMKKKLIIALSMLLTVSANASGILSFAERDSLFYAPPYLQSPTPSSMTVMFQTIAKAHCFIEYGTDTLRMKRAETLIAGQAAVHDIEQKILLDSLAPGTTYFYRICAKEVMLNKAYHKEFGETIRTRFYSFSTPSASTTDFTALIFNDTHNVRSLTQELRNAVKDIKYDFTVFNGDCLPEPSDRAEAIASINFLASAFEASLHPAFFIRGNHEIRNAYSSGMPSLLQFGDGKTYGAFSWGDTRFIILDCGEDKPDSTWVYYGLNNFDALRREELLFLKKETKSREFRKAKKRIAISHIPVFGNVDKYQPCTLLWGELLKKTKLNAYIGGHTHEFKVHNGTLAPYPVFIGGGPSTNSATVFILKKQGERMTIEKLNAKGERTFLQEL